MHLSYSLVPQLAPKVVQRTLRSPQILLLAVALLVDGLHLRVNTSLQVPNVQAPERIRSDLLKCLACQMFMC